MILRSLAALFALSLAWPSAVRAGQPASATPTLAELRAAAAGGSAQAEYELAERLATDGVDEHRTEAIHWLKRAAAQGNADAQTHLSWAYHSGVGVEVNDVEAVKWERLAAEKGQASAQFYLASDYELGLGGLPKDDAKAAHWYYLAAEQKHPIAQARLGDMYAEGRGVPHNDSAAVERYLLATVQKDFRGYLGLGRMYAAGRGVPKDEKKALLFFERAAQLETENLLSALNDGSMLSDAQKRDYFLSISAGRHDGHPGPSKEWEALRAKLLAAERAERPPAAPVAKPEEFCPRLAAVMAAGMANFTTLRGKEDEALPGMHACSIDTSQDDDVSPFTYRCTVAEKVEANAVNAIREANQRLVSQCLGASWHAEEVPHPGGWVAVYFTNPKSPLTLRLDQHEWWLSKSDITLAVDSPLAPLTLERAHAGGAVDLDSPVNFKSEKAGAHNVLHAFGELLGSDLLFMGDVHGKVTLSRQNVPLREALNAVCAQIGCVWSFKTNEKRRELYVEYKKP